MPGLVALKEISTDRTLTQSISLLLGYSTMPITDVFYLQPLFLPQLPEKPLAAVCDNEPCS